MINPIQITPDIIPSALEDDELLMAHMATHAFYKEFRMGRGKEDWTLEEVVQMHHDIRQEIESRESLEHEYISALDEESTEQIQQMDVQMAHKDDAAKEWVDGILQSEEIKQYIKENPPSSNWYTKAVEFLQEEDPTIDLTEHVSFAAQSFETFDEPVQEWIKQASGDELDAVGYYFNEDTETGVLLIEQESEFSVYVDNTPVETTSDQVEALELYQYASRLIQDGGRLQYVVDELRQESSWVVPEASLDGLEVVSEGAEFDLEQFTEHQYGEAKEWEDLSEDERLEVTQMHAVSASGTPAKDFGDLYLPLHSSTGEIRQSAVEDARTANLSSDEIPYPTNLKDDIEVKLSAYQEAIGELEQGTVHDDVDVEGFWYVWDQAEAERWMENHGFGESDPEKQGSFLKFDMNDAEEYDYVWQEWMGPTWRPGLFVPAFDEKPVLVTLGENDDKFGVADVISVRFVVEGVSDFNQIGIVDADKDWYWWKWDQSEVEVWLNDREIEPIEQGEDGEFFKVKLEDEGRFDRLEKKWQGKRAKPEGQTTLAGGEKPRRVVYGVTEDGEKIQQAIEFYNKSNDNPLNKLVE